MHSGTDLHKALFLRLHLLREKWKRSRVEMLWMEGKSKHQWNINQQRKVLAYMIWAIAYTEKLHQQTIIPPASVKSEVWESVTAVKPKHFLSPNQLGHQIKTHYKILNRNTQWHYTNYILKMSSLNMSLCLFTDSNPVIQIEKIQVTYFCLSPWVEAVGVAVLVYWTWGYWWDWSGLIHYEDAPYMTKSSGQWGETQIRARSDVGCRAWPCRTHITVWEK